MPDLIQAEDGTWYEPLPRRCPKGHSPFRPGWEPCRCGGHRRLDCDTCRTTTLPKLPGERCSESVRAAYPDGIGRWDR